MPRCIGSSQHQTFSIAFPAEPQGSKLILLSAARVAGQQLPGGVW